MTQLDLKPPRNAPAFTVYFVQDRKDARWVPIGAAWTHKDGEGHNLALDFLPTTPGRIVLRTIKRDGGGA